MVSLPHRTRWSSQGLPLSAPLFAVSHPNDVVWQLKIEQGKATGVSVLTVAGRVSHRTAPDLAAALEASSAAPDGGVVVDLSAVDYISSPGLRVMETAASRLSARGRRLVVCGLRDAVSVAFDLAGLSSAVAIEESREQAIRKATGLDT